jgi:hypothetical protein
MYPKNKSINRLKNLKYINIYISKSIEIEIFENVIRYSYVWNLSLFSLLPRDARSLFKILIRVCETRTTIDIQHKVFAVVVLIKKPL